MQTIAKEVILPRKSNYFRRSVCVKVGEIFFAVVVAVVVVVVERKVFQSLIVIVADVVSRVAGVAGYHKAFGTQKKIFLTFFLMYQSSFLSQNVN